MVIIIRFDTLFNEEQGILKAVNYSLVVEFEHEKLLNIKGDAKAYIGK